MITKSDTKKLSLKSRIYKTVAYIRILISSKNPPTLSGSILSFLKAFGAGGVYSYIT